MIMDKAELYGMPSDVILENLRMKEVRQMAHIEWALGKHKTVKRDVRTPFANAVFSTRNRSIGLMQTVRAAGVSHFAVINYDR